LPLLYVSILSVVPGDTPTFAADDIRSGFAEGVPLREGPQQVARRILATQAKGTDDALVSVAWYLGGRS